MTTELEKQFFDTFEIEPSQVCGRKNSCNNYVNYKDCNGCYAYKYPQITDRHYLELICILGNTNYFLITDDGLPIDVDWLKKSILHSLTLQTKFSKNVELKHQVQELFKGEK